MEYVGEPLIRSLDEHLALSVPEIVEVKPAHLSNTHFQEALRTPGCNQTEAC
jgi:hypothetical protein